MQPQWRNSTGAEFHCDAAGVWWFQMSLGLRSRAWQRWHTHQSRDWNPGSSYPREGWVRVSTCPRRKSAKTT